MEESVKYMQKHKTGTGSIIRRLNILYSLLHENDEILRNELNLDDEIIYSEIAKYQELLDKYEDHLKIVKESK